MTVVQGCLSAEHCETTSGAVTACARTSGCHASCTSNNWWVAYRSFLECTNNPCYYGGPRASGTCHNPSVCVKACSQYGDYYCGELQECNPRRSARAEGFKCNMSVTSGILWGSMNFTMYRSVARRTPSGQYYGSISV